MQGNEFYYLVLVLGAFGGFGLGDLRLGEVMVEGRQFAC